MLNLKGQPGINDDDFAVVTANSEGVVRVWQLLGAQLRNAIAKKSSDPKDIQVGKLLSSYETGNRITCLKAFVMMPSEESTPEDFESSDGESEDVSSSEESDAD